MPMLQETLATRPASKSAAWKALEDHQRKMRDVHLRDLFADDPGRGQRMTARALASTWTIRKIASAMKH